MHTTKCKEIDLKCREDSSEIYFVYKNVRVFSIVWCLWKETEELSKLFIHQLMQKWVS